MSETLPLMLKELRLPAFGQYYQNYQAQASEQAWSYSQYLAALCEQEVARRFQSRICNWTREARLPRGKSFATLTLADLPQPVQKMIRNTLSLFGKRRGFLRKQVYLVQSVLLQTGVMPIAKETQGLIAATRWHSADITSLRKASIG